MKLLKALILVCLVVTPFLTGCAFRREVHAETENTQRTISAEPVITPVTPPAPAPAPSPQGTTEIIERQTTEKRVIERKIAP